MSCACRVADQVRIEPRALVDGNEIRLAPHVIAPDSAATRYLHGIDMVALLEVAPGSDAGAGSVRSLYATSGPGPLARLSDGAVVGSCARVACVTMTPAERLRSTMAIRALVLASLVFTGAIVHATAGAVNTAGATHGRANREARRGHSDHR